MLRGKKILLGVCGSIAAYKSAYLVRELVKQGAEVKVVMTTSASAFIAPLTLATLSKNPVHIDFVKNQNGEWTNHVELGLWADLMVIAPISANTLAKLSNGLCDNLLSAVYLSAKCPVMVAPAMDLDMFAHPSVQKNIQSLVSYGNIILDSPAGELASGLEGKGRMLEPEQIAQEINHFFETKTKKRFAGKKVMITAGPTFEHLDPVRFIGNHSSGKMGLSIAEALLKEGAEINIVLGPVSNIPAQLKEYIISVNSADEMLKEAEVLYKNTDISIFAAAVADYKPAEFQKNKIKKNDQTLTVELVKNPDIAFELGKKKSKNQFNVGFALETANEEFNAKEKLQKKNFDLIVLNSLNDSGAGFKHDTNKISIIDRNNIRNFELKSKNEVANDIINAIAEKMGL